MPHHFFVHQRLLGSSQVQLFARFSVLRSAFFLLCVCVCFQTLKIWTEKPRVLMTMTNDSHAGATVLAFVATLLLAILNNSTHRRQQQQKMTDTKKQKQRAELSWATMRERVKKRIKKKQIVNGNEVHTKHKVNGLLKNNGQSYRKQPLVNLSKIIGHYTYLINSHSVPFTYGRSSDIAFFLFVAVAVVGFFFFFCSMCVF